jgi:serine/threonine protein phosphatase PrpC
MKKKQGHCSPPVFAESLEGNRDYQEDYYAVVSHNNKTLFIVTDGMGGHSGGDLASQWVAEELLKRAEEDREFEDIIGNGIEHARQKMADSGRNMGATFAAAMVEKIENRYRASLSWIGDSRIYALTSSKNKIENAREIGTRGEKTLWLLTEDDSFIWGFVIKNELTVDQVSEHPNKNRLEHSIHPDKIEAAEKAVRRTRCFILEPGDKLLLCTDGVWESFPRQSEITGFLDVENIDESLSGYLKAAINEGRCADNATYTAVEMNDGMFAQNCFPPGRAIKKKFKKITASRLFGILFSLVVFILILLGLLGKFDPILKPGNQGKTIIIRFEPAVKGKEIFIDGRVYYSDRKGDIHLDKKSIDIGKIEGIPPHAVLIHNRQNITDDFLKKAEQIFLKRDDLLEILLPQEEKKEEQEKKKENR